MLFFSRNEDPSPQIAEDAMLQAERAAVMRGRGRNDESPCLGLALSGGGIRSATFCLGALQRLAKSNLLQHFDYMSTVSGGGYAGLALQWWWNKLREYDAGAKLPFGIDETSPLAAENPNLAYLRWHASYLAPGGGISLWSGIAVLLRTLVISLFVWLPVTIAAMFALHVLTAPRAFIEAYRTNNQITMPHVEYMRVAFPGFTGSLENFAAVPLALIILLLIIAGAATTLIAMISILVPPETIDNRDERVARAWRCAKGGVIGVAVTGALTLAVSNSYDFATMDPPSAALFILACGFGVFAVCAVAVGLLQMSGILEFGVNYAARREYDLRATLWFPVFIGLAVLVSLPFAFNAVSDLLNTYPTKGKALLGLFTLASGFLSGLYGHFVQAQRLAPGYVTRWAAALGAGAFLYLMLLLAYFGARFLLHPDAYISARAGQTCQECFAALLVFSIAFGRWSNLNYLGLHRFYRDRLMEAFLPSKNQKAADAPEYSDADRLPLADIWKWSEPRQLPYPLINTNAIMINDKDLTLALRGGTNFLLSPRYIGSTPTGWLETKEHDKRHGPMTLASAMAASGAAANANAGYIGTGITRDRLVSVVMMLLNFRLGLWIGAPRAASGNPNYFSPALKYGVFRSGYHHDSTYLELTDGGHFDNLGVYELIRRRCDLIVALDSEEDPSTAMSALASICQRAREDFGVTIQISDEADAIAPVGDMGYPSGAKFAKKSYFLAAIVYPEQALNGRVEPKKISTFVYLKSGMIKGLSFPAKGYKAKNPDFPNQSTMDQFFDSAEFEAYRELGYASANALANDFNLNTAETAAALCGLLPPPSPRRA